jgi:Cytochrome c554 and c-prime
VFLRLALPISGLLALGAALGQASELVGSQSCRTCHARAFEIWQTSPHAKAGTRLSEAQMKQASCGICHAPELVHPPVSPKAESGVTCEACHGAGQLYSPSYVMRDPELARAVGLLDPGPNSCLACHRADVTLMPFDFNAKVKLIDHWTADRAERRTSGGH